MLYTLQAVKDNIRNRDGKRVFFLSRQDRLTASAEDYLRSEKIPVLPAEEAKITRYKLLNGGYLDEKPEHMTHLNGDVLVSKLHPRIAFRGAMDTLEAELLLCQLYCGKVLEKPLGEILTLARKLLACEVMDEPCKEARLCGMTAEEIRSRSHRPQDYYGVPHFMPQVTDGAEILHLNRARCAMRNAERTAVAAFTDENGCLVRTDLVQMLNRMSSLLYILMIESRAKNGNGNTYKGDHG